MDNDSGALVALRLAPARAYRELLYRPAGALALRLGERFEIVARPGHTLADPPQSGDVLLGVILGEPDGGRCDVLIDTSLIRRSSTQRATAGWYCTVNGTVPRPRRILDTSRRLPPGQLLLRVRALDPGPVWTPTHDVEDDAELLDEDRPCACTRCLTESGHPASNEDEHETSGAAGDLADNEPPKDTDANESATVLEEFEDTRDDDASPAPIPVDTAAAVPPFDIAERAVVVEPLLTPAESASAVAWSTANHPAMSGIALADINAALANYVDAAAVQSAILRRNALDPTHPIDASSLLAAPVIVECVHQFQRKCYLEPNQHDGKAGESTLDSLGLIARTGMRTARKQNKDAHQRLIDRDKKVQAATAGEFSAANWFARMTDPSVFGWTTKASKGLHVVLVRKLRQAERYLLTLGPFRGMTPARLGTALGLTERHGGARPEDATADMHTLGLAIDISYMANPWIHNESSWRALKRAASLITGTNLAQSSVGVYLSGLATGAVRSTGEVWDELHQRNDELIAYLRLDRPTLEATLSDRAQGWPTPVVTPGEPIDDAVRQWSANISEDNRDLDAGDFNGHLPAKDGFLTHPRDLVIALRDHGCLAWGAVDFGPSSQGSGDMMHFDARVDGVGRVLAVGTKMCVPTPGHHPCLPATSRTEESEEQSPTIPCAPVSDLITELKARRAPLADHDSIAVLERLVSLCRLVGGPIGDRTAVRNAVDAFLQAVTSHPLSSAHQVLIGDGAGDLIATRLMINGFASEADRIQAHFHSRTSDYESRFGDTRTSFIAMGSGFFPDASRLEGGFVDRMGQPLHTLQDFRAGKAQFVSVAMDVDNGAPYGTRLTIDEFPGVVFRVVDTGDAFIGKGTSRVDIATADRKASLDPTVNGQLHLTFAIPLPVPQTRPHETTEESALGLGSDDGYDRAEADPPSACPLQRLPGEITRSRAPGGVLPIDVVEGVDMLTVQDFAVGSDVLPSGVATAKGWQRVMSQLTGDPTSRVAVTGFTDCVGSDAENASLRKRRALAIVAAMPALVQQRVILGFPTTTDFLDDNSTIEGRARNRAVRLKLALDNTDEPAISKASNLDEFLYLVRILERKLKLTTPADAPKVLSVLRQLYYGSASWSCHPSPKWDDVIRKRIWPPTTDPTPLLGSKLVTAFKATLSVEGVDPGHVLTGLDAMMAPGFVDTSPMPVHQDVPNEAWATWAGDLASAAGQWVADTDFNTLKGTGDLAWYIGHLAADDDLTGDVDAFALRAGLNGSAGPGQLGSVARLSGRLSSTLLDYYRVTASPLGQAREHRMRNFISAHGGSVVGGHLQDRARLEAALRPSVRYLATAWWARDYISPKRSGQRLVQPGGGELESASDSVTGYFVDWLFTRAVAEPGP